MTTIGIQPDRKGITRDNYSEKWAFFLQERDVNIVWLNLLQPNALEQASKCDGIMWRWAHIPEDKQSARPILYTLEQIMGISIFPNIQTAWHYDDKIAQYYLLKALDAPLPNTWVFWSMEEALQWANKIDYPVVFKLSSGAGSSNVVKVNNSRSAGNLIRRMFQVGIFPQSFYRLPSRNLLTAFAKHGLALLNRFYLAPRFLLTGRYPPLHPIFWKPEFGYTYFQEFIPENNFDTRITIIGDRGFAFRRWNRPNDFRASGSGKLDYDQAAIDPRFFRIAFEISRKSGFQSMAYDFISKENKPILTEISYTFQDQAVFACPGYVTPDLEWHEGSIWPEEAQVIDFLHDIEARKDRNSGHVEHPDNP